MRMAVTIACKCHASPAWKRATNYEIAGHVDRHNRHRQLMLKFAKTWKTKRWETRVQLEVLGLGCHLVDTCLVCRYLMPKWKDRDDTESNFLAFVATLMPQVDGRTEAELDEEEQATVTELLSPAHTNCAHTSLGKRKLNTGEGKFMAIMQRCTHCTKEGRCEKDREGVTTNRKIRTSFNCRVHTHAFICKTKGTPCMQEHLREVKHVADDPGHDVPAHLRQALSARFEGHNY